MCFLDFVKQDQTVRLTANLLCELPSVFVANIASRCPNQARYIVSLHKLRHINFNHRIFIVENFLCQSPSQLGFTNPSWTKKYKRTDWPIGMRNTSTAATNRLSDHLDCFVLPNNMLLECLIYFLELFSLNFYQAGQWNPRSMRDNSRDFFFANIDDLLSRISLFLRFNSFLNHARFGFQARCILEILAIHRVFNLIIHFCQTCLQILHPL